MLRKLVLATTLLTPTQTAVEQIPHTIKERMRSAVTVRQVNGLHYASTSSQRERLFARLAEQFESKQRREEQVREEREIIDFALVAQVWNGNPFAMCMLESIIEHKK